MFSKYMFGLWSVKPKVKTKQQQQKSPQISFNTFCLLAFTVVCFFFSADIKTTKRIIEALPLKRRVKGYLLLG